MTCSAGNRFPLVERQYMHRHTVVRLPDILLRLGKHEMQSQFDLEIKLRTFFLFKKSRLWIFEVLAATKSPTPLWAADQKLIVSD
jgi:hypothetical protein